MEVGINFIGKKHRENDYPWIVFNNKNIEPSHAAINFQHTKCQIMDLGSGFGTYINGLKIPALKWFDLNENIQICFGNLQTKFNMQLCDDTLRFSVINVDFDPEPIPKKSETQKNMEIEKLEMNMRITRRMKKAMRELQDKCINLTEKNIEKYVLYKK